MNRRILPRSLAQGFNLLILVQICYALPLDRQIVLSAEDPRVPQGKNTYTLPVFDPNSGERFEEILINRNGFQYGPPLLGNTSFFPTGVLGDAMVQADKQLWFRDVQYITEKVNTIEWPQAARALAEVPFPDLSYYFDTVLMEPGWGIAKPLKLQHNI